MVGRVNSTIDAEISSPVVRPVFFVWLDFPDNSVRIWSGLGEISWNGFTWSGLGSIGSIQEIEETTEIRAAGVELKLSGIPADLFEPEMLVPLQKRQAKIWLGFMTEYWTLISVPVLLISAFMDTVEVLDGGDELTFTLRIENNLRDLQRPRVRRYTDADQQSEFPGDKGFMFVPKIQRKAFKWGTKAPPPPPVTWSPTDKVNQITLSTDKLMATRAGAGPGGVRATDTAPRYWEAYVSEGSAYVGLTKSSVSLTGLVPGTANSWLTSLYPKGTTVSVLLYSTGEMYVGVNGEFPYHYAQTENDTSYPITFATGVPTDVIPTVSLVGAGGAVTGKFKSPWWHSPPSWATAYVNHEGGDGADHADPGPGAVGGENGDAGIGSTGDSGYA